MHSVYKAAGGHAGLLRLAQAWHERVMADEIVSHAFRHGFHPQHHERLAAYWAEALGGPAAFSGRYGDETSVVRIHSGNGPHEEMDRRAIACFDQALDDVGLDAAGPLRQVLHDYFAWATSTSMARYHESADDVPDGMPIPRWSWDGREASMTWLPADFSHPTRVPVSAGYHLRPITAADADLDYPAVMGSQPRLWSIFGPAWDWPAASMTYQQDRADLARHEAEIAAHQSFNYALLDDAETALLGCVYIDPAEKQGADAEICWWVVDGQVGTGLQRALDALVPRWIAAAWPFTKPRYIGHDLSWADWLARPDIPFPTPEP